MKFLIYIETDGGKPASGSIELIDAASSVGAESNAVLIGNGLEKAAEEATLEGAASVTALDAPDDPTEEYLTEALSAFAEKEDYSGILLPASVTGKHLAGRLAGRLGIAVINDAVRIRSDAGTLTVTRPAYSGALLETVRANGPAVISLRRGSYEKREKPVSGPAVVKEAELRLPEDALRTRVREWIAETEDTVDLESARVIVTGGRGMGSRENFALCKELADLLGGVLGATRPVIENGWIGRTHQVGQSGKIVAPDLYIACGVSGAVQHLSGIMGSRYIIAINKDEDAPIFSVADLGIVGDVKKILPLMIEELRKRRENA
ncbi:MAG: electron transfer flavoprotein subunit alpha/FixB family protein [Anaerovoracaceae bacterium]|jgi:electron transfer flavoprotein alpha subunit